MSRTFKVKVKDKEYKVEVEELSASVSANNECVPEKSTKKSIPKITRPKVEVSDGELRDDVIAPLPGVIADILVKEGSKVKEGDKIVILEAMKMENALLAPITGKVETVHVKVGQEVGGNYPLITIVG